jgi:hypothetical protein
MIPNPMPPIPKSLLSYMRPETLLHLIDDLTDQFANKPDDTTLATFLNEAVDHYYTYY